MRAARHPSLHLYLIKRSADVNTMYRQHTHQKGSDTHYQAVSYHLSSGCETGKREAVKEKQRGRNRVRM